jgi:hypothetical protein
MIGLVVVLALIPSGQAFAQDSQDSSDAPAAGVEVRPGRMVELREANYDARSYVAPRRLTGPRTKLTTALFEVEYEGFTPEAEATFQAAVDLWSTLIASPVVIKIKATWEPLGLGVLGSAGAPFVYKGFSGAPDPDVWYPSALADSLHGSNLGLGVAADILASFNSSNRDWYFGTDGETPNGKWDLMSVVMHEIAHGLGFAGSASVTFSQGSWGLDGFPVAYDQFTEDGDGNLITDRQTYPNPSVELGDTLQGLFLFWGGLRAVAVNEGERPHLYAPPNWQAGSSYAHLSEEDYPPGDKDSLMTPFLGASEGIHDPGPITLCLFQDIGWTTAQDCGLVPDPGDGDCVEDAETRCLQEGRFEVKAAYLTAQGDQGPAKVVPGGTDDSLNMWFFNQNNWELLVKVLDGCANNNHYWVFIGGTTNAGVSLRVRDTVNDVSKVFENPIGVNYLTVTDTAAFSTCP